MAVPQANRVAVAISMVSIVAMVLNNEIFKVTSATFSGMFHLTAACFSANSSEAYEDSISDRTDCGYFWNGGHALPQSERVV